jgi:hypothetical protein
MGFRFSEGDIYWISMQYSFKVFYWLRIVMEKSFLSCGISYFGYFFFTSIPGIMAPVAGHLIKLSLGKCLDGSIISNTPEHFLRTIQKPITSAF